MNVDRLCYAYLLTTLPILLLPKNALVAGLVVAGFWALLALFKRQKRYALLALAIALSYAMTLNQAMRADQVSPNKISERVKIVQVLKQQAYQTAIAERENGDRLYLNWQSDAPLTLAQFYQVEPTLRPISSRLNSGNFDRQKWYFAQHIDQIGTVRKAILLDEAAPDLRTRWLSRAKQQTDELATQGLLLALAFGERAWLSEPHWQLFQQTSTAHLIAISGLHIALAMGIGVALARAGQWAYLRFRQRLPTGWQAVIFSPFFAKSLGFATAFGYSFLAGFAIPTLRALVAIALVLACQWGRRYHTPWQLWFRGVSLLVLMDPMALLSDSFWLSVLAVASLILWYQCFPLAKWRQRSWDCVENLGHRLGVFQANPKRKKTAELTRLQTLAFAFGRFLFGLFHLEIGIWLIFSPVQLYFFDGVATFGLLANVLIVPFYSLLLVPLILFSLLTDNLFFTWQLSDWLAQISLTWLVPLADWAALDQAAQWWLLAIHLGVLAALYGWQNQMAWQKTGLISPLVALAFYSVQWLPALWHKPISAQWLNFDVGQGLAMVLVYPPPNHSTKPQAIVYDTGSSWQGGSMAQLELLPYLQRSGVEVVALFLSHDDNDHAGGADKLLAAYPKARLISPSRKRYGGKSPEPCLKGQQWQFGEIKLTALHPHRLVERAKNGDSCVLLVEIGRYKLLWTGDSGAPEERQFAEQAGKIDFLQVGHHGSNTSSSPTLLAHTQPSVAIISAGRWNPWRLPSLQVEKRLTQHGITHFNTAQTGLIRIDFTPQNTQISPTRTTLSPWYQGVFGGK